MFTYSLSSTACCNCKLLLFFFSNFEDIFDVKHFIDSLRDEVRIVRRLPKRFNRKHGHKPLEMPPVSWSNENFYMQQVLLFYFPSYFSGKQNLFTNCTFLREKKMLKYTDLALL